MRVGTRILGLLRGLGELSRLRTALAARLRLPRPSLPSWQGVPMPRRLLVLNALLLAIALAFAASIARHLVASPEAPAPSRSPGAAAARIGATTVAARREPTIAYEDIARRSLFSPTRTEVAQGSSTAMSASLPRPYLYGVVLTRDLRIAYFEDPATKRLAGYRIGDALVGGILQRIDPDRVVIARPDGPMDVRLRDPGKPRSTALATAPPAGVAPPPGVAGLPRMLPLPPQAITQPPGAPPQFQATH